MAGLARVERRHVGALFLVHLLEVVPQHRAQHPLPAVVRMHTHPGETGARHLPNPRVRSRDGQDQRKDAVDPGVRRRVGAVHVRREALLLGQADQLLLGGRRRDLGEPDGVVGGQVALRVGRAADPHPVLGHGLSQPLMGDDSTGLRCLEPLVD
jgi:hypothetical protein